VGLNRPCRVVLTGVHKKNKPQSDPAVVSAFSNRLKRYCNEMEAKFVSYEPNDGVWTFEVRCTARCSAEGAVIAFSTGLRCCSYPTQFRCPHRLVLSAHIPPILVSV
jgi:hypothetical protein